MAKKAKGIEKAFLMWIGEKFYPTFEDFKKEAIEQGVSKRVPNAGMAQAIMGEGNVVFLAHDDGEKVSCPDCAGSFECPDCGGSGEVLRGRGSKRKPTDCERCGGEGEVEEGTGGSVIIDGEQVPFKLYVGKLRHPKEFKREEHDISLPMPCDVCSGTGNIPQAKIYGMFVPTASEYIVKAGDDPELLEKMKEKGLHLVDGKLVTKEAERGCGKRKPGGVYVVTDPKGKPIKDMPSILKELAARGLIEPEAVEVKGSFVEFLKPVEIVEKRFRGVKEISLPSAAVSEAEHILEALE